MTNDQNQKPEKKKLTPKKIVTYLVAAVVIIGLAIYIDYDMRNPRCVDETAALNRTIQEVLPRMNEIPDSDGFGLDVLPLETIEGKDYYPVQVTRVDLDEEEETTGIEEAITTVYIRVSDSRYYIRQDGTAGPLVPYTGQPIQNKGF